MWELRTTMPANIKPRKTMTTIPPATMPRINQIAVVLSFLRGGGTTGGLPDALDMVLPLRQLQTIDTRSDLGMFRRLPQTLNFGIDQIRIVERGHLARVLSGSRLQARAQRFVPLH